MCECCNRIYNSSCYNSQQQQSRNFIKDLAEVTEKVFVSHARRALVSLSIRSLARRQQTRMAFAEKFNQKSVSLAREKANRNFSITRPQWIQNQLAFRARRERTCCSFVHRPREVTAAAVGEAGQVIFVPQWESRDPHSLSVRRGMLEQRCDTWHLARVITRRDRRFCCRTHLVCFRPRRHCVNSPKLYYIRHPTRLGGKCSLARRAHKWARIMSIRVADLLAPCTN